MTKNIKLITAIWIIIGLLYLFWGLYWILKYSMSPGVLWLFMTPSHILVKDMGVGIALVFFGIKTIRTSDYFFKNMITISSIFIVYFFSILVYQLILWKSLFVGLYFADLLIPLLHFILIIKSKYFKIDLRKDSLFDSRLLYSNIYFVVLPFIFGLLFEYFERIDVI